MDPALADFFYRLGLPVAIALTAIVIGLMDGVPNAAALPWDAFPRDPKEWKDTDGDGTGDNADEDDDGDGYSDKEEERAGTDPSDPLRFPAGAEDR